MIGVQRLLKRRHGLDHSARFGVVEEARLLLADSVLGAHATVYLAHVVHYEGFNDSLGPLLETLIVIAREDNI